MKRKTLSLLLVLVMALSLLTACGAKDAPKEEAPANNEAAATQEAEVNEELSEERLTGIQTVELYIGSEMHQVSYDADVLICESDGHYLDYYDPVSGDEFRVYVTDNGPQDMIDDFAGYDWVENYSATPIEDQYVINDLVGQSFTQSYINRNYGDSVEETFYFIPINSWGGTVTVDGLEDPALLDKAIVSIDGNVLKPLPKGRTLTLKDPDGNEIYRMTLADWADGLELISNENGKASFEYTTEFTSPAEIHVNAYYWGEEFVDAVSGKYWVMDTPQEREICGGNLVTIMACRQVDDSYQLYEDMVFYLELPDGNLITGVCDYDQPFIDACFENGLIDINAYTHEYIHY